MSGLLVFILRQLEIEVAGQSLTALASKALFWPAEKTAFVADVHLGKAAAFRARSIPVPHGTTDATLLRLSRVLEDTAAETLVVLGDLWHDKLGRTDRLMERFAAWTSTHPAVKFILVTGNHDIHAGPTPKSAGIVEVDDLKLGPFCCAHHPEGCEGWYVLSGHIHPAIALGNMRNAVSAPCFWFGPHVGVLPAFGDFTGSSPVRPEPEDLICAVAGDEVVPLEGAKLARRR